MLIGFREVVVNGDTPNARLKQGQAHDQYSICSFHHRSYPRLKEVLAKIKAIVDQVKGRYSSSFEETEEERAARIQLGMFSSHAFAMIPNLSLALPPFLFRFLSKLTSGLPEVETNKSTGNLLDAARAMADALAGLGNILDGPEEYISLHSTPPYS